MPTGGKDYYKILQVDSSAEAEVIIAAYHRLSQKYHPDRNKSPDATRRMQSINEAYEVLRGPIKRAAYDRSHSTGQATDAEAEKNRAERERQRAEQEAQAAKQRAEQERRDREKAEQAAREAKSRAEQERQRRQRSRRGLQVALLTVAVTVILALVYAASTVWKGAIGAVSSTAEPRSTMAVANAPKPIDTASLFMPTIAPSDTPVLTLTPTPADTPTSTPTPMVVSKLQIVDASASSSGNPQDSNGYWAKNAVDGDTGTIWLSGNGDAIGAWLQLTLDGQHAVHRIGFNTRSLNDVASQIQDAKLQFSDGSSQVIHLRDLVGWQYIDLDPVSTSSVRIVVNSVYPGRVFKDHLFVAEVELYGDSNSSPSTVLLPQLTGTVASMPTETPQANTTAPTTTTEPVAFADNFDHGMARGWNPISGRWVVDSGAYKQLDETVTAAKSMVTLPDSVCYTFDLKASVISGSEGFLAIFKFQGKYVWWNIGGWTNTFSQIEGFDRGEETRTNDTVVPGQWYLIKIIVDGDQTTGWLNGTRKWSVRRSSAEVAGLLDDGWRGTGLTGLVGVGTWSTQSQFDDVKVTMECK